MDAHTQRQLEARKREEAEFHDRLRSAELLEDRATFEHLTSNKRFYSIDRKSRSFIEDRLTTTNTSGQTVLDYCCGNGRYSFIAASHGALAKGIDISPTSIDNCKREAQRLGLADRAEFSVMDAENLAFPDDSFDIVCISGVLHHLDLSLALPELARVLRPGGAVVCVEALGHNPIIQLYRKLTPHLRTSWETQHIIHMKDLKLAKRYFGTVETTFFHLATLAAVPFYKTALFGPLLRLLESVDAVLLRLPAIREQAWMIGFVLRRPIKK